MDQPIAASARRNRRVRLILALILIATILAMAVAWIRPASGAQYVARGQLRVEIVQEGLYEDFTPVRLVVEPEDFWRLDLIQGGSVEAVYTRDGDRVEQGQALLRLSNPEFELQIASQQAALAQNLAGLQAQELRLAQMLYERQADVDAFAFAASEARRDLGRKQRLYESGFLSEAAMADLRERARFADDRVVSAAAALANEEVRINAQLEELARVNGLLQRQLSRLSEQAAALTITAPGSGRLTGFDPQVGARLEAGAGIGRVDVEGRFKLTAQVDEFYLGRVSTQLEALAFTADGEIPLTVTRVRPQITNGRFQIELAFQNAAPDGLRPGQSFEGRVMLSEARPALILPVSASFAETGGHHAFVIEESGDRAVRREIQIGRRNPTTVEILGGLEQGDRVIVSSYRDFENAESLVLTGND
jgi:HlyD family secretion protein